MRRSVCCAAKALAGAPFGRQSLMTTLPMALVNSTFNSPGMLTTTRGISNNNMPKIGNKKQVRRTDFKEMKKDYEGVQDTRTIDELCLGIDTTLTPVQRVYVEMLKKKISGGAISAAVKCKFLNELYFCDAVRKLNVMC
jgi:hypothetical protein